MNSEITQKMKKLFPKDKKITYAISIGLVCIILLLLISGGSKEKDSATNESESTSGYSVNINDEQKNIENRLKAIIEKMDGVCNAEVMIMMKSSGENVYAVNSKTENNGDKKSLDSEIVLYENENGNNEGLIVSVKTAQISGVAIVCEGGENPLIKSEITNLVTNLFGIGSDRVYVGSN